MFCLSFILGLLLSAGIPATSATLLDLHLYSDTNASLLCNDGSPSGYYFRPATPDADPQSANLWIVQQEGGGWCWDEQSCVDRLRYLDAADPSLMSSREWSPQRDLIGAWRNNCERASFNFSDLRSNIYFRDF